MSLYIAIYNNIRKSYKLRTNNVFELQQKKTKFVILRLNIQFRRFNKGVKSIYLVTLTDKKFSYILLVRYLVQNHCL